MCGAPCARLSRFASKPLVVSQAARGCHQDSSPNAEQPTHKQPQERIPTDPGSGGTRTQAKNSSPALAVPKACPPIQCDIVQTTGMPHIAGKPPPQKTQFCIVLLIFQKNAHFLPLDVVLAEVRYDKVSLDVGSNETLRGGNQERMRRYERRKKGIGIGKGGRK